MKKCALGSARETLSSPWRQMNLAMDGKCQFRSSHGGPIYVQVLSPGLLLVLGFSVLFSLYINTYIKEE